MGEMREVESTGVTRERVRWSVEKLRQSTTFRQSNPRVAKVAANRKLLARELANMPEGDA